MFRKYKIDNRVLKEIDKTVLFSMIVIILFGILNIYLCTMGGVYSDNAKKQLIWFVISMAALYIFLNIDYSIIINYVPLYYWACVALLIATHFIGSVVNGARSWIRFGPVSLQPAELAKIAIILMVAKCLDEMEGRINNIKNFFTLVFYCAVPVLIIYKQPDMGMVMVCFFIVLGMFFIAGLDMKIIGGGLLTLVVGIIIVWNSDLIQSYQKNRIICFLDPYRYDTGEGYHLIQSLIGIGSGGLTGSRPSIDAESATGYAALNVPEVHTDFIFSAIAEQWGFIGSSILIALYGIMILKMITIAKTAKDIFGSTICVGIISYFIFAFTQNIFMTIGLLPITGITLPLVSYGGSSLLTTVLSIGLVLNVGMRRKSIHF